MSRQALLVGFGLLILSGCGGTSSYNLVEPGSLRQGEESALIEVPVNVSVMILEIDGKRGDNSQAERLGPVFNNTFTQSASVEVAPGPHKIRVACFYVPGIGIPGEYRVREIALNLKSGEIISLFAPEQEKAVRAGLVYPRTSSCPIRVKSSLGREVVLPDPGG
ncbi:MAG: hypothetical protein IT566_11380 [Rhodospirillaceae bacterium]|nr:hypothetical protein [Rhodospirillaceae bacterium]